MLLVAKPARRVCIHTGAGGVDEAGRQQQAAGMGALGRQPGECRRMVCAFAGGAFGLGSQIGVVVAGVSLPVLSARLAARQATPLQLGPHSALMMGGGEGAPHTLPLIYTPNNT